ncbi:FAD-binding protein [Streptomyces prunicolor]|uniref:FAD-binding protein n=1 Tax=Streptomyces prunicolor TaxID=67348 RepID=UPI0037D5930F
MTELEWLPAEIEDFLATKESTKREAADDFGHIIEAPPLGVLSPRSVTEIQRLIAFAGPRGLPVAARGGAQSVFGQGQAQGGIVVDMGPMNRVLAVHSDRAVVQAGATWNDVLTAALPYRLAPPVLTEDLSATVGGVVCAGGIGGASHRYGLVADTVMEIEVVTGAGEHVTCSPRHEATLFHAVLAGLGRHGIIVRATVRLAPAPERVRRYGLQYSDFASCLDDQRRLALEGRFCHLEGRVRPSVGGGWHHTAEVVAAHTGVRAPDDATLLDGLSHDPDAVQVTDLGYDEFLHRIDRQQRILRVTREWLRPHPWLHLLLPDDTAQSIVTDILSDPAFRDLRSTGEVLLHPLSAERLRSPSLRRPPGPLVHLFGLRRTAPADDPRAVERMVAANKAAYERARALGAVVYPVSAMPMSAQDWRDHYGDHWRTLMDAKRRHDPHAILGKGL